jgi:hypothetical protein
VVPALRPCHASGACDAAAPDAASACHAAGVREYAPTLPPVKRCHAEGRAQRGEMLARLRHVQADLVAGPAGGEPAEELVESLARLYCYLYGEPEAVLRPAAVHRARAMGLSDQWVREGCQRDSRLLTLEHSALVRSYAALLAAVHH